MGRSISLFADYKGENALTNYCGLILKLLYRESPASFEEVVVGLVPDSHPISVGPVFLQQLKVQRSIPDLLIQQRAFNVWFETKLDDWFYSQQLEEHLKGLSAHTGTNVLIALSNFEASELESRFAADIAKAAGLGVHFRALTFEEFVEALEGVPSSQGFKEMLAEFVQFLDRGGHLPKWKYLLEVVNCAATGQGGAQACAEVAVGLRKKCRLGREKRLEPGAHFRIGIGRGEVNLDAPLAALARPDVRRGGDTPGPQLRRRGPRRAGSLRNRAGALSASGKAWVAVSCSGFGDG